MRRIDVIAIPLAFAVAIAVCAAAPVGAQTCGPLNNGRVADVVYKDNAVFFDPIVGYEYDYATLTISGPCEDIVRTFAPGEQIFFDLGEITRVLDGQYNWELRFSPAVDSGVRETLEASRGSGEEDAVWWSLWQKGSIPPGPSVDNESFSVVNGAIVDPGSGEESQKSATVAKKQGAASPLIATAVGVGDLSSAASAEEGGNRLEPKGTVLTNADGIIRNSLCVGFDCPNSPTFSDSTVLMMENNTRIKFDDTSTISGFPNRDWEIQANSNSSGGGNYLAVNDCGNSSQGGCAEDPVFKIEAGARSNALYVESDGDVGVGTSNPVLRMHLVDGDTPGLRLEQDGSSGFAPQTWDVAGNETSFFVRDASNGSTLPFRIRPGASSNSLVIDSDDDIGIGVLSPSAPLHISRSGAVRYRLENTSAGTQWDANNDGNGDFAISLVGTGGNELEIEQDGDIGNCGNPDHDFVLSTGSSCSSTPRSWIDAGSTSFSTSSSRAYKENLQVVDVPDILSRIREVPVYEYDFIGGPKDRIGLVAEDFHQVFERGSDKELSGQEVQVAMWLAIQALDEKDQELEAKETEISDLKSRIETLERVVQEMRSDG